MNYAREFATNPLQNVDSLLKFTPLAPRLQHHIAKVYLTLSVAFCVVSLGAVFGVLPHLVALLGSIGCTIALSLTPAVPSNLRRRYGYLGAIAFCLGSMISPLITSANFLSPSIVVTAVTCTAAIFACFSISALITPRRTYMFLGGYLASATTALCLIGLFTIFVPSSGMYSVELYLGLLVFAGYILFDTQIIVERAAAGDLDHVKHAALLLMDAINLFTRIIVILMRNQRKREEAEQKRSRKN